MWRRISVVVLTALVLTLATSQALTAAPSPADPPPLGVRATGNRPPIQVRIDRRNVPYHVPARKTPQQAQAAKGSTFAITFLPAGAISLGNACQEWPADAQAALQYAAGLWGSLIQSSVPITVDACWASLPADILGSTSPGAFWRGFSAAPTPGTWYAPALANALSGADLDPSTPDMTALYAGGASWYFGTDGLPAAGQADFVTVALHELAHGLGFVGSTSVSGGLGSWGSGTGYPVSYDRLVANAAGQSLVDTSQFDNPSTLLAAQLTSDNLYFDGSQARAANGGERVKIYAPATWTEGSSYSHLDTIYDGTPNALMTFSLAFQESEHDPGPIAIGILRDAGWQPATACYSLTRSHGGTGSDPVASPTKSAACSADGQYAAGEVIGLTATPAVGWQVAGWTGTSDDTLKATTNQLTMPASALAVSVTYGQSTDPCANLSVGLFCARYFSNTALTGTPTYSLTEKEVNHDWGTGGPGHNVPVDHFSARYEGTFSFEGGQTTFFVRTDDGVSLWVDGSQVVAKWNTQAATVSQATVSLNPGTHAIKMEYFEDAGEAVARLYWAVPCPAGQLRAEYFSNTTLSGMPAQSACEPAPVYYDWSARGPTGLGSVDSFSARWTGSFVSDGGFTTFVMTADDGMRVWVDSALLLDKWQVQGSTTYRATTTLAAGAHKVRVEYYENNGDAVAKVNWYKDCSSGELLAQYFPNTALSGTPAIVRCEIGPIAHDWGTGSPGTGVPVDSFSARFEGKVDLSAGSYTFTATADDGVRVWVDGSLVIDQWKDQAPTTYRATKTLTTGVHAVRMDYYERAGGAVAKLSWARSSTTTSGEVIVDDKSSGFTKGGAYWRESTTGYLSHSWWTYVYGNKLDSWGEWRANLSGGSYEVFAYVPSANNSTVKAKYTVYYSGGSVTKTVSQSANGGRWVSLGTYTFASGTTRQVRLTDTTGEAVNSKRIAFDAVKFVPSSAATTGRNQGLQGGAPVNDSNSFTFPHSVKNNLPIIQDSGAGWIRINFRQTPCNTDWETSVCAGRPVLAGYDDLVRDAKARGLKVLGVLSNESWHGYQANWIANAPEDPNGVKDARYAPGDNAYMQAFSKRAAVTLIKHYKQADILIDSWEVWNEPNCAVQTVGGQPRGCSYIYPSNFAWLLRHVYEDTHAAGITGVSLVSGGVLGTNPGGAARVIDGTTVTVRGDLRSTAAGEQLPPPGAALSTMPSGAQYLADTYRFGISTAGWEDIRAKYNSYPLDDAGQHIYIDGGVTTSTARMRAYLDDFRSAYVAFEGSYTAKKTVVTEFGWPTNLVSAATQAANLRTAYAAFKAAPYVRSAYWFFAQDQPESGLYFGLWTGGSASDGYKGTAREAFRAYQQAAAY